MQQPTTDPRRLKHLLRDLLDIYSPSGKEEEIVEFLASYLHEHGLPVTLREVGEGRRNLEVVFSDRPVQTAFIGHVDTVPAFDIEQYAFREDGDTVHGLGASDMKSGCAAMIEAFVSAAAQDRVPDDVGLFLVVGEEETGDGTAALLEARRFPWAFVAEPTDLQPCLAHYGYLELLISAYGTRRHAAAAGPRYNAILGMLRTLLRLAETIETQHPDTTLNIRDIHSAAAGFAVPGSCEACVDLHIPPDMAPELLADRVQALVHESLTTDQVTRFTTEFPTQAAGYQLSENDPPARRAAAAFARLGRPWQPGSFRSHSDANLLCDAGCKSLILGPGQLAMAHTRDERVSFQQVADAARIYRELLEIKNLG